MNTVDTSIIIIIIMVGIMVVIRFIFTIHYSSNVTRGCLISVNEEGCLVVSVFGGC
jgi:hypothetical protein